MEVPGKKWGQKPYRNISLSLLMVMSPLLDRTPPCDNFDHGIIQVMKKAKTKKRKVKKITTKTTAMRMEVNVKGAEAVKYSKRM